MKFGLVFAGGGIRGAYQIGVWKALKEMNIDICAVAGASIGAINGALFVQDAFDTAHELWDKIAVEDVICVSPELENETNLLKLRNVFKLAGEIRKNDGLDTKPLENLLDKIIDEDAIRNSDTDFVLTTYSLTDKKLLFMSKDDIPQGKLVRYLLASSCLPVFKPKKIDGKTLIDGGMADNMPLDAVIKKGISDIITVNVKGIGFYRDVNTSGCNIINIECKKPHMGTLEFDSAGIKNSMTEGYLDCKKAFGRLFGDDAYFNIGEYAEVYSKYSPEIVRGVQCAARAFGIDLLREVGFETLAKEVTAVYLIEAQLWEGTRLSDRLKSVTGIVGGLENSREIICALVRLLETDGFDFAKSKLDIMSEYEAASAIIYLKKRAG